MCLDIPGAAEPVKKPFEDQIELIGAPALKNGALTAISHWEPRRLVVRGRMGSLRGCGPVLLHAEVESRASSRLGAILLSCKVAKELIGSQSRFRIV
jgi:hypothetical protein